jgi:hypothetical protein
MKKYLSHLIKIDIHHVVSSVGYWDKQIGELHVSLVPELINGRHVLSLFVNHLRQPMTWELSFRYHRGWLQRHGFIPHDCSEVWYVVGANRKRYQFLYIDTDTCRIGTRDDHFPTGVSQQYRQKKETKKEALSFEVLDATRWRESCLEKKTNFCVNIINEKRNHDWGCKKVKGRTGAAVPLPSLRVCSR